MSPGSRRGPTDEGQVWLTVHDASAMLGVSPATLRRWSAAGEVEAFTTPGGHRRFARSTIEALLPKQGGESVSLASLGESPERMFRIMRRHIRAAFGSASWLVGADEETRSALRGAGRAMATGLLVYLDDGGRRTRDDALRAAEAAAAEHGRQVARHGGELAEAVGSFMRCRALFVDDLAEVARRGGLGTGEAIDLMTRATTAIDRLLLALMEAYAGERTPAA